MARALECPACGHRHRVDGLPAGATFRCEHCGQVLKAPASVSSQPDAPAPPARGSAPPARSASPPTSGASSAAPATSHAPVSDRTGAPAPIVPPRRTVNAPAADATRERSVRTAAGVSATVAATAPAADDANGRRAGRRREPGPGAPAPVKRTKVHWYWRVLAWIVAVPIGFLLTAWPAYKLGFIKKDDLLNIFVGTGTGRYVRLVIVTLVWAVVTALLVQLLVEGGRIRANRRRARATAG